MTVAAALEARDLAVGYRSRGARRAVLEHVNVAVRGGDFVCLLGPNGIGKSTLLRTLARMQPMLWGSVWLDGAPIRAMSQVALARRLGVVLTERVVVDSLSVRRVVEFGRFPHSGWFGVLTSRDREAVDWAIGVTGVQHLADRDFNSLSDGERQRVMVARALAQEPVLLLLDEPTAFLDVPSRVELMALLRKLTRESSLAVIVATHDLELALRAADKVWLVMPGGELRTGAPEDVIASGGIAEAFEGRQVRFDTEARSFRWLADDPFRARLKGTGLRAAMAAAVLEREGYAVSAEPDTGSALSVDVQERGWHVTDQDGEHRGDDFASLATFLR